MSKNIQNLNPHQKELTLTALYESAKQFDGTQPVIGFIDELLTDSEKITIGRRILIAQMILAGSRQTEIREKLNVSPNTFTRTRKWLEGQIPKYGEVLEEYKKTAAAHALRNRKRKKERYDPLTFKGMRKKYPMHFLFFNLAEELHKKITK